MSKSQFWVSSFSGLKDTATRKKVIMVARPKVIGKYTMELTDYMDKNINRYRIGIRSKKCWLEIFSWLLDVSLENAYYL